MNKTEIIKKMEQKGFKVEQKGVFYDVSDSTSSDKMTIDHMMRLI